MSVKTKLIGLSPAFWLLGGCGPIDETADAAFDSVEARDERDMDRFCDHDT
jgi:hypothetical protein